MSRVGKGMVEKDTTGFEPSTINVRGAWTRESKASMLTDRPLEDCLSIYTTVDMLKIKNSKTVFQKQAE